MITIRPFIAADVPRGMVLSTSAGWNQLPRDWERMVDLEPAGCFVAQDAGQAVGTVATCLFGSVAWIAMVLVDAAFRGRGIGTALMRHALAYLDGAGVRTIRLDATELGRPVYEKLGFVPQFQVARYDGMPDGHALAKGVQAVARKQWHELARLDCQVVHTERTKLLMRLFEEEPAMVRMTECAGKLAGFIAARRGRLAWQIGPCVAVEPDAGQRLFRDVGHRFAGKWVFIDIPSAHERATALAGEVGLRPNRSFWRMVRGPAIIEDLDKLWASSGPEKG